MRPQHFILSILTLLALAFCFAACTPDDIIDILSGDDDQQEETTNPTTPTGDKNTVTVTTDGALVTHGNISINFPKGTFTTDSKVTIVGVKKGDVGGQYEASEFFKVTMPATTNKKLTIKVKADNLGDDVNFVMLSTGYAISLNKATKIECFPETNYSNGEYTTTIQPCENGDDSGNVSYTIGLGRMPSLDGSNVKATRGLTNMNWALASGEVDGVSWDIYMSWEAWSRYDWGTMKRMKEFAPTLNESIKEAIKEIRKLGFKLNGNHSIPYYFADIEDWGAHVQHWANNNLWSSVYISIPKILEATYNMTPDLKNTVIHETLHYFHSDYDPRYFALIKAGADYFEPSEHVSLSEMGAVWVEKFLTDGKLSTSFQLTNGVGPNAGEKYRLGLSRSQNALKKLYIGNTYQDYGYAQAPLLEYLISNGKQYGITDKSVVEIYDKWGELASLMRDYTLLDYLNLWTQAHNWNFFDGGHNIDDYYLKLWKGDFLEGFNFCVARPSAKYPDLQIKGNLGRHTLSDGAIYPYGCEGLYCTLTGFKDVPMKDKELVIRQLSPSVHTYLLLANSADVSKVTRITQFPQMAEIISEDFADSIVVSGAELEKYRNSSGVMDMGFFLLTTRQSCYTSFTGSIPSTVVVDLRKVNGPTPTVAPTTLYFSADGGKQNVKVEPAGYARFGATVRSEGSGWCGVRAYVDNGCYVEIGTQPNTSTEQRECIVDCYVTDVTNPTDAQKVKMPVHVVQEGKAEDVPGGESDIIVTSMHESAYAMMVNITVKNQAVGSSSIIDLDKLMILHPESITFSQNGSTLHLVATKTSSEKTETFSCDVTGITLADEFASSKVVNAKYTSTWSNNSGSGSETITFGEIPLTSSGLHSSSAGPWASTDFKLYESGGLKVTSYAKTSTSTNYIGGGTTTTTYKYVSDPENMIDIDFNFDYTSTSSDAPRHRAPLTLMPWTEASSKK